MNAGPAAAGAIDAREQEAIADAVVQMVGEMDDRTSPEDWPEAMLVTGPELHAFILLAFKRAALASREEAPSAAGAAQAVAWEDATERYLADIIDRAPDPLRRLGEWLSRHLDEDEWKTAERYVLGAMEALAATPAPEKVETRLLRRAEYFVSAYADRNPKHDYEGVKQDPSGVHALLAEIRATLKAAQPVERKDGAV